MADLTQWTLDRLTTKIRRDLELNAEIFVQASDIKSFINDAIDDAEELIVDSFSDHFRTFEEYTVEAGDSFIALPEDIYEMRIRGLYYDKGEFNQNSASSSLWYKIKKLRQEMVATVDKNDNYQYMLDNSQDDGRRILIYPHIREDSAGRFRLFYIRKAKRLDELLDVLEEGLRPQYIMAHAKLSILQKEGSDMIPMEAAKLQTQTEKLLSSLSRVSDDEEDSYLTPDNSALYEAYGDGVDSVWGF